MSPDRGAGGEQTRYTGLGATPCLYTIDPETGLTVPMTAVPPTRTGPGRRPRRGSGRARPAADDQAVQREQAAGTEDLWLQDDVRDETTAAAGHDNTAGDDAAGW